MRRSKLLAVSCFLMLAACAGQTSGDPVAWYGSHGGVAPKKTRTYICHGFGCAYKTPIALSSKDLRRLKTILARGRASPSAERKTIANAVQWMEKRVAAEAGSANDVGGLDMRNAGQRGQMDCIDESTNTNSLLLIAEKNGYLKFHKVTSPVARGFFLDGRYPHATATIKEKSSGQAYAVDSWVRANGRKPDVIPLEQWFQNRSG